MGGRGKEQRACVNPHRLDLNPPPPVPTPLSSSSSMLKPCLPFQASVLPGSGLSHLPYLGPPRSTWLLFGCFSRSFPSPQGQGLTQFPSSLPQQLQAPQLVLVSQNPAPAVRKKSQEKKSNFKRAFSHKKHSSEEPKRAGPGEVSSPESRPLKRPSFLPLCVGGHQPSTSSSPGEQTQSHHSNTAAASSSGTFSRAGIGRLKGCHPSSDFCSAPSSVGRAVGGERSPPHARPHCPGNRAKPTADTVEGSLSHSHLSIIQLLYPGRG